MDLVGCTLVNISHHLLTALDLPEVLAMLVAHQAALKHCVDTVTIESNKMMIINHITGFLKHSEVQVQVQFKSDKQTALQRDLCKGLQAAQHSGLPLLVTHRQNINM